MTAEDDEILKMKEKLAEMEREASSLREQEQGIDGKALDEEMAKHPENAGGNGKPQKTPEELEKELRQRRNQELIFWRVWSKHKIELMI